MVRMWKWLAVAFLVGCSGGSGDETNAQSDDEALAQCSDRKEMILWSPNTSFDSILDPLTPNLKCTHWYVGVPLSAGDKVNFHGGVKNEIDAIHKRGSNFHALAEFQWTAWRQWTIDNGKSWYDAGVEFRRRMDAAGFQLHYGDSDTWAINELPSSLVHSDDPSTTVQEVRANAMNAIRGLFEGPNKDVNKKGVVYRVGVGQDYTDVGAMSLSKQRVEAFLSDDAFWASMDQHVRWWADETYADPMNECVPGTLTAIRSRHINDYVFHLPELAEHGPATARNFLRKTFTPLLNGAWKAPLGYGRNDVPADDFIMHVSTEVYAVRAWQGQHPAYGNRLGFAWVPHPANDADKASVLEIGKRIGNAVDDVYKPGHGAAYACSPNGAYTFCSCSVNGAQFIETWATVWDAW
jgi:hypothetical protein